MNSLAAAAYRLAPVWGQNLLLSGFGLLLDRERYSGRFAEFCALLDRTQWMSRSDLVAYQDERLKVVVAHAYVDQLVRNGGLAGNRTTAITAALKAAEAQQGTARAANLTSLATALEMDLKTATDPAKVKMLHGVVKELAAK